MITCYANNTDRRWRRSVDDVMGWGSLLANFGFSLFAHNLRTICIMKVRKKAIMLAVRHDEIVGMELNLEVSRG